MCLGVLCRGAWSLAVPERVVIVRQGPAPCFQVQRGGAKMPGHFQCLGVF